MATYALTVSTNALGLGVISSATVVVERKRTTVTDIYPTSSLYTKKAATNVSGIATIQLEADDGTVFHEVKIFDTDGVLVYKNTIQMPPQASDIEDLPLNDIVNESAYQAVQAKEDTEQLKADTIILKNAAATSATNAQNAYSETLSLYNASTFVTWFSLQNAGVSGRVLIRNATNNSPTRIHIEPNSYVNDGTITKTDWMFDPYQDDPVNYRIVNLYTKVGNGNGLNGENGAAIFGVKGVGDHFGIYPSLHFGFGDDGATGVPMKMYYFDMSDTAWRTPLKGAWRQGRSITAGDYILANSCLYQAQNTETTGATKPNHTSGTVNDGGVDWLFIRNFSGATSNHIKPVVIFGERDDMPKFGLETVRAQFAADTAVWNGKVHKFLNNAGVPVFELYNQANTNDLYIKSVLSGGNGAYFRFNDKFFQPVNAARILAQKTLSANATTVVVDNCELVTFGNTLPTTITNLTGNAYQYLIVETGNTNTTLQNNANIILATGLDTKMIVGEPMVFKFNGDGTVATQIGSTPSQTQLVQSYVWASRPTASASNIGKQIYISDLGVGAFFVSDGTYWRPVGGRIKLQSAVSQIVHTGVTGETSLISVSIPAGLMTPTSKIVVPSLLVTNTNNANAKTLRVRYSTIGGSQVLNVALANVAAYHGRLDISNRGSLTTQVATLYTQSSIYGTTTGVTTTSVNTANASSVVLSGDLTNAADAINIELFEVEIQS